MWKKFRIFMKYLLNNTIVIMVRPMNTNKNIIFYIQRIQSIF